MKKLLFASKILLSGAILTALPLVSQAHTYWCNCYCGGTCNCGGGGYAAPLDGGISLLAVAGIGYGVRKYRKNKASQQGK